MDVDWYEASVAVLSDCKIVGHIAREVARTVENFLKFKGKILQVIYAKFGGISNKTVVTQGWWTQNWRNFAL